MDLQFLVMQGAVPQVEVDQVLIGHADLVSQGLEVGNRSLVQPDGDRLLEPGEIPGLNTSRGGTMPSPDRPRIYLWMPARVS